MLRQDPFVTRILRDEKKSRIEFVANTGGLLGLCTGFSFITFCEIIYQVPLTLFSISKGYEAVQKWFWVCNTKKIY